MTKFLWLWYTISKPNLTKTGNPKYSKTWGCFFYRNQKRIHLDPKIKFLLIKGNYAIFVKNLRQDYMLLPSDSQGFPVIFVEKTHFQCYVFLIGFRARWGEKKCHVFSMSLKPITEKYRVVITIIKINRKKFLPK